MVGSITLLLAFLAIFLASGSFDFIELTQMAQTGQLAADIAQNLHWYHWDSGHVTMFLFCGAFLGFAVKTPIVPFHGWLPSAYAEAPPETTMVLTGALSKMGVYGFLRILLPIFPEQMWRARTHSPVVGDRDRRIARVHRMGANGLEEDCLPTPRSTTWDTAFLASWPSPARPGADARLVSANRLQRSPG